MALKTKWLFAKTKSMSCTMTAVWRAVVCCKGCAVIFHSPMGCVHVAASMDLGNHYRLSADGEREVEETVPLVSSNLREKDSIFGGIDRLHDCIAYTMKTYHPECLLIASSCTAGVIGDDVDEEAASAEEEYGIPVMSMPFAGFLGGEYSDGYYKTAKAIMDRFFVKNDHEKDSMLLLGDQMGPHGQYVREVTRLLTLLGLHVDYQFPGYVPFKDWKNVTKASYSVMLGTAGQPAGMVDMAKRLETEFGVKCVGDVYPTGFESTCRWIRQVAETTGRKDRGDKVVEEETKRLTTEISSYLPMTKGKKAAIAIGRGVRWYHPRETLASLRRLALDVEAIYFLPNLTDEDRAAFRKEIEPFGSIPIYEDSTGHRMEDDDVLLTTNEMTNVEVRQLFIPMVALAGFEGEQIFLRSLYRLLCRRGRKGGIAYVKA